MEANSYKKIQSAYQKIIDSETSFKELTIATILEEVKKNKGKIVLKKPFKYDKFSSYHTLYSNGNFSGYYKNPDKYCGDEVSSAVSIEHFSITQLKELAEIILMED